MGQHFHTKCRNKETEHRFLKHLYQTPRCEAKEALIDFPDSDLVLRLIIFTTEEIFLFNEESALPHFACIAPNLSNWSYPSYIVEDCKHKRIQRASFADKHGLWKCSTKDELCISSGLHRARSSENTMGHPRWRLYYCVVEMQGSFCVWV